MKKQGRVTWDGLVVFRGNWLIQWEERVSWSKLSEQ